MLLIADSGSTKTQWCLVNEGEIKKQIFTKGINPFYQSESEIKSEIELTLLPELLGEKIDRICFYGAGCSFPDKKMVVSNALGFLFRDVMIEVYSDLLAAARSLFGVEKGIACILGTGSNSCYYDGVQIVENVSPLGFVLGDEGSGAVLGKTLVADCLKSQLPDELKVKFLEKYNLTPAEILEAVYKKPFPNRFLAQFTPFLSENIANSSIYNIVYNGFLAFLKRNVMQYELEGLKIGVVGSVGYYMKDVLSKAALDSGLAVDFVVQSPMSGLIKYHENN